MFKKSFSLKRIDTINPLSNGIRKTDLFEADFDFDY